MTVMGKEQEIKNSSDELAVKEVESYVERIEKQAEVKPPVTTGQAAAPSPTTAADDAAKKALGLAPKLPKSKIMLPLSEEQIRRGLHHKVIEAIRWLAEWSIYIIKKYPGRVFYPTKQDPS